MGDEKILVVGRERAEGVLKAVKESNAKVVVVDSCSEPKLDVTKAMAVAALSEWMMPVWGCLERKYRKSPKEMSKCRLPECDVMTSHNGGYCSPEHCMEHRKRGWRREG